MPSNEKMNPLALRLLYGGTTTIEEFNWDQMQTTPLSMLIPFNEVDYIRKLILSPRYSGNSNLKMKKIDEIMHLRGFTRFACGTNRIVYTHPSAPNAVFKIALDSVGIRDNPTEFYNQNLLKPYCCKVFECSPCGTIASFERVDRITSIEEFVSIADDYFYLLTRVILGKYVMDDIGIKYYMNIGIRKGFGPVLLDFPYLYELDGNKLYCSVTDDNGNVCGGEIDYHPSFNYLVCSKCGRQYFAHDVSKPPKAGGIYISGNRKGDKSIMVKIWKNAKLIKVVGDEESAAETKNYLPREDNKRKKKNNIAKTSRKEDTYDMVYIDGHWESIAPKKEEPIEVKKPEPKPEQKPVEEVKSEVVETVEATVVPTNTTVKNTIRENDFDLSKYMKAFGINMKDFDKVMAREVPAENITEVKEEEEKKPAVVFIDEEKKEEEKPVEEVTTSETPVETSTDNDNKSDEDNSSPKSEPEVKEEDSQKEDTVTTVTDQQTDNVETESSTEDVKDQKPESVEEEKEPEAVDDSFMDSIITGDEEEEKPTEEVEQNKFVPTSINVVLTNCVPKDEDAKDNTYYFIINDGNVNDVESLMNIINKGFKDVAVIYRKDKDNSAEVYVRDDDECGLSRISLEDYKPSIRDVISDSNKFRNNIGKPSLREIVEKKG